MYYDQGILDAGVEPEHPGNIPQGHAIRTWSESVNENGVNPSGGRKVKGSSCTRLTCCFVALLCSVGMFGRRQKSNIYVCARNGGTCNSGSRFITSECT
jgi:phage portal protein BeeE